MRDLHIYVPEDCSAAETTQRHRDAIEMIRRTLGADTTPSDELDLNSLRG
jgi:hypothetical protein